MPSKLDLQRAPPTLLDVLGQYGTFDVLCRRLDTATLFSLRLVSKRLADHFAAHFRERWNVNRRLKHFVRNPQGLRSLMAHYGALIAGSFVIQFFDDCFWKASDLDIYVERESAAAFGTYLCRKEGYRHDKVSADDDDYDFLGFIQVDTYLRGDEDRGDMTKIQIISTRTIPARTILGCFSTTAVINIMSWNTAYSMFPKLTFLEPRGQCQVSQNPNIDHVRKQIEKYSKRGWKDGALPWVGRRCVGDRHSWKITLDITGVKPSAVPDYVLENCHFMFTSDVDLFLDTGISYQSVSEEHRSDVLRYRYTDGRRVGEDFSWWNYVNIRLRDLLLKELRKLDPEHQPGFLARPRQWPESDTRMLHALYSFMAGFAKPDTWTYYDDQVPTWRKEWEDEEVLREVEQSMADVAVA